MPLHKECRADGVGTLLQLDEHVESVPRRGYSINSVHAVTDGSDEVVTTRPDRLVLTEFQFDVIHAVVPSTLADEFASRLLVLDGDLGDTFVDFSEDELGGAGLVAGHTASPPSARTMAASSASSTLSLVRPAFSFHEWSDSVLAPSDIGRSPAGKW